LHHEGFIRETELVTSGVGRKAALLDICGDLLYTIGIEIDKSVLKIGIVNYVGEIIYFQTFFRNPIESYEEALDNINQKVKYTIEQSGISFNKIIGLAVGLPGFIDYKNGIVRLSDQLRWTDVPFAEDLKQLTSLNVIIDNGLKMKVMAEHAVGIAKGSQNSILVGIGSGIGAAIILNGEIYRGESNNAGEIGHTVVDPNGNVCSCGKIGCIAT
jgi:N-acetylglucosamine repressor